MDKAVLKRKLLELLLPRFGRIGLNNFIEILYVNIFLYLVPTQ